MKFSNLIRPNEYTVSRDALGSVPVYYYVSDSEVVIADNIKDILRVTGMVVELDIDALNEYFTFQNIFSDRTLFRGIRMLPAGHRLEYNGETLSVHQYYDLPQNKVELSEDKWTEYISTKLRNSVERLVEEGDGAFISGGLDSASVAYIASKKTKLKTFTMGFDLTTAKGIEQTFDERKHAEEISRLIGSEHYEMVLHSSDMRSIMPELIYHLEDLRVGMSYPNFYAMRLASKYTNKVFSGEGGDELFGGYPWRYELVKKSDNFEIDYFNYWNRLIPKEDKRLFFNCKVNIDDPYNQFMKILDKARGDKIDRMLYFEAKTFLPACSVVDYKYAKANGVTIKSPFNDLELANLAFLLPHKYKYKGKQGKYLLRKIMSKCLPENITKKKKQGFSPPDMSWYQNESLPYIRELLLSDNSCSTEYINPTYIGKLILEHSSGLKNHRLILWSLISFEWWCRIYLGKTYDDIKI